MRKRLATPVFGLSLLAYAILYAGDIALGDFAAFGAPQVVILTLVVATAAAILFQSYRYNC